MKDRKTKEKKHESTIGKIIYGFLLFMPLFAIGVTCLVNTFNKEVTQETQEAEIEYKYETNEVNTINDIVSGNIYHFSYYLTTPNGYVLSDYLYDNEEIEMYYIIGNITSLNRFSTTSGGGYLDEVYFQNSLTTFAYHINLSEFELSILSPSTDSFFTYVLELDDIDLSIFDFDIVIEEIYVGNQEYINDLFSICENVPIENVEITTHESNVNDIFYYAVDKVQQSPLFNWAQNSIIYTGMYNFTTGLSISTTFIPLLLTYWLIISVVYFLYDIVLIILVVLHRKIHYLEESI